MNSDREHLKTRLGFILLSAGCAIGCGNVWKFPYLTGQNGGGVFVLFYLIFLIILGLPIMTMEYALGRASQKSPVKMLNALAPKKKGFGWYSIISFGGNVLLLMFYTTVAGWFLRYFVGYIEGSYSGMDVATSEATFGALTQDPVETMIFVAIVCVLALIICSFSLTKGLEKVSNILMLVLFALIIALAVNSILLKGGGEGLKFYLLPDFSKFSFQTISAAMNQAFFTLSLGIGSMAIFGSYIGKERALMGESLRVIILDTTVAIIAGLIIFPACSAYGVNADAGASLIFITLPSVFTNMPGGRIWGIFFFLFMTFAALSTVFAVFENIVAMIRDLTNWNRIKTSIIVGIALIILAIPCVLGFSVWSDFQPFAEGTNVSDLESFFIDNIFLPLGCLTYAGFCMWKWGWGQKNFIEEANTGKGMKVKKWMIPYMKYVLPLIIIFVFILGLATFKWR